LIGSKILLEQEAAVADATAAVLLPVLFCLLTSHRIICPSPPGQTFVEKR